MLWELWGPVDTTDRISRHPFHLLLTASPILCPQRRVQGRIEQVNRLLSPPSSHLAPQIVPPEDILAKQRLAGARGRVRYRSSENMAMLNKEVQTSRATVQWKAKGKDHFHQRLPWLLPRKRKDGNVCIRCRTMKMTVGWYGWILGDLTDHVIV